MQPHKPSFLEMRAQLLSDTPKRTPLIVIIFEQGTFYLGFYIYLTVSRLFVNSVDYYTYFTEMTYAYDRH